MSWLIKVSIKVYEGNGKSEVIEESGATTTAGGVQDELCTTKKSSSSQRLMEERQLQQQQPRMKKSEKFYTRSSSEESMNQHSNTNNHFDTNKDTRDKVAWVMHNIVPMIYVRTKKSATIYDFKTHCASSVRCSMFVLLGQYK